MKLKLFLLLTLLVSLPAIAQQAALRGVVIDSKSSQPVAGLTVMLNGQGASAVTGPDGDFLITDVKPGSDQLLVLGYGYKDLVHDVQLPSSGVTDLGTLKITPDNFSAGDDYSNASREMTLSESQLEDEEGNSQAVGMLTGATDNPFYQAASYNFSAMRFRMRGYNSEYTATYINGIGFNDAARGRFNYSMLGGLNQAFKNKSIGTGLESTSFAFGDVGGANNITTYAKDYAPGFRGSVAYTNANYRWRGMATYSTGLTESGWALTLSAVGRYADEGVIPGSFYNSWGYFLAVQKQLGANHSLALTTFGAPTSRASNSATFQEAYDLVGSNLYNSNWGWQCGKKRNAKVVDSYDPTVLLNWLWDIKPGTKLNTGVGFHKSFYASSALNWYNARDPRPDYYRYLPSYYASDPDVQAIYTDKWLNDPTFSQINWDELYQTNHLNNYLADETGVEKGATYILEKRHSNQASWMLNTNLNSRLSEVLTLQGGASVNYTVSSYYKTIKDLLGGRYWTDIDQFAERDFPSNADLPQNDLNNPNRRVRVGDRFGYDYNINSLNAGLWLQNTVNLARWDFNYGANVGYTSYQRDGKMRNGRAPENSFGKGVKHDFVTWGVKGGAVYKLDGRNSFHAHAYYGTHAPLPGNAYVSPRIKDDVITDLKNERILSGDLSYVWNYRRFMGSVTGYWTEFWDQTERTSFYDDLNSTFMNYALTGVRKEHKGVEVGLAYKVTPSVTVSAAANLARYQYKNRPTGTRSYENGSQPDVTQTVYLKNFYVGGTPQEAYSLSFNWAAPNMWFFEVNGTWMNRAYIDLSPIRHEKMDNLWTTVDTKQELEAKLREITTQEKLNEALIINMSIGKVIYLSRTASLNVNLNLNNLLDNRNIQTGGYQQGRFDYTNFTTTKYPNKIYYGQGFKMYLNLGVRF
ncbi:MAG: TonB-dependent receptor [Bacteroidales bacterium]|nr:TonB-dependent receptor [Bacteroidales bacterium]MDY3913131.1 carboxypeptidase-like regulatory domain-containing protein [Sodaliphilus sp.]